MADGKRDLTELRESHPLRLYFADGGNTLANYLSLDDSTIWGGLALLGNSKDEITSELANRLRHRDLYKCLDVSARAERIGSDVTGRFRKLLAEADFSEIDVLQDRATVSPYKFREYESDDALSKIMIRLPDGCGRHDDVAVLSPVIKALEEKKLFRVYARSGDVMAKLEGIWTEAKND